MIPNLKLYAIGAAALVCFGAGFGFHKIISDRTIAKMELKHAEEISDREQTLMEIERQASAEIARLNDQADQANKQYLEGMSNAKIQIDRLVSDLESSRRVFKPKVKACVQTSKTSDTGAVTTETRAELDQEIARSLVGITARCDEITLQLNALIDAVKF